MFFADIQEPTPTQMENLRLEVERRAQRALLRAVAVSATHGKTRVREAMAAAGLGRLGQAIAGESDKTLHMRADGFSASARFYVRTRNDRTRGAIEAYTEGAEITPVRSRWLWIPTDNTQRVIGSGKNRRRLTPAGWREAGLDRKIGPLVMIKSVNGLPLLAVESVGVNLSGQKPSAKSLRKNGMPRKGQTRKELVVMFVAIPRTARSARVSLTEVLGQVRGEFPAVFGQLFAGDAG